jgi:hypothetical protein
MRGITAILAKESVLIAASGASCSLHLVAVSGLVSRGLTRRFNLRTLLHAICTPIQQALVTLWWGITSRSLLHAACSIFMVMGVVKLPTI